MKSFSKSWKSSKKPKKQRKFLYNAPLHIKSHFLRVTLSKELRERYKRRNLRVVVGDKVKILRGDYKGKIGKVSKVDVKHSKVYIDNVKVENIDGSLTQKALHPSNLMIIELNLKDSRRIKKK